MQFRTNHPRAQDCADRLREKTALVQTNKFIAAQIKVNFKRGFCILKMLRFCFMCQCGNLQVEQSLATPQLDQLGC